MLENFTYQAKRSVVGAQEAARDFGHDHIGTEHLLLGLLREERSPASLGLKALGLQDGVLVVAIEDRLGRGEPSQDPVPFDLEAKTAIDLATDEAKALRSRKVGAEHLLFAMLRERASGSVKLLEKLGVNPDEIRPAVTQILLARPAGEEEEDPDEKGERPGAGLAIGEILVEHGVLSQQQLDEALEGAADKLLGRALIDLGLIKEGDLVRALATQIGLEFVDLSRYPVDPSVVHLIPAATAWRHHCLPISDRGGVVLLAMSNPADTHAIDDVRVITNRPVEPVVALASDIERALRTHLGSRDEADEEDEELPVTSRAWSDVSNAISASQPWRGPDDSVLGTPIDVGAILAVTETGVFLAVSAVEVYPSGFIMRVTLRRRSAPRADKWFEAVAWQHRWQGSGIPELSPRSLRIGVELPDGSRVDNLSFRDMPSRRPPAPCMISLGASGSVWRVDAEYWVWPLPTEGTASFFCEWPSEGVALTKVPIDCAILAEAAAKSHVLWDDHEK